MVSTINPVPKGVENLGEKWNIRGFILLSFTLETILILCAPFRKRSPNVWIVLLICSACLLIAAYFAIGPISYSQGDDAGDLLAFWAPFLLLRIGGLDTITSFALEDNMLWLRRLLGLVFQVVATSHVFIQSFPTNKLWPPTLLLFLAGTIRYAERTHALYLASREKYKTKKRL